MYLNILHVTSHLKILFKNRIPGKYKISHNSTSINELVNSINRLIGVASHRKRDRKAVDNVAFPLTGRQRCIREHEQTARADK